MKKQILLIALIIFSYMSFSQYSYRNTEYVGSAPSDDEIALDMTQDSDGNMYAVGQVNNGSDIDISLSKFDTLGNFIWEQIYDNGGDDIPLKVEIGENDNIYITGNSEDGSTNKALIVKYDPNGSLIWDVHDGGISGKTLTNSKTNLAGKTVLIGYYNASADDINAFVTKYDKDGSSDWNKTYDYGSEDEEDKLNAVSVSSINGDIYVGGVANGNKMLLIKYNASGSRKWVKTSKYGEVLDLVSAGTSKKYYFYIAAASTSASDAYTAKYDPDGALQWDDTYSDGTLNGPAEIHYYKSRIYVFFRHTGGSNEPDIDDFIIKYDLSGDDKWKIYGKRLYDNAGNNDGKLKIEDNAKVLSFYDDYIYANIKSQQINKYDINTMDKEKIEYKNPGNDYVTHGLFETNNYLLPYKTFVNHNILFTIGSGKKLNDDNEQIALQSYCIPLAESLIDLESDICGSYPENISFDVLNVDTATWAYYSRAPYFVHNFVEKTLTQNIEFYGTAEFYVRGEDKNTCPSYDTKSVTLHRRNFLQTNNIYSVNANHFCEGYQDTVKFKYAINSSEITWVNTTTDEVLYDYDNLEYAVMTETGDYYAIVIDAYGCKDTSSIEAIRLVEEPSVNLGNDITECADYAVNLVADTSDLYNYLWNTGETTNNINVYGAGNYSVTISAANCTDAIDDINIDRISNPKPNLGNEGAICENDILSIDAGNSFVSYTWNNGKTTQIINTDTTGVFWVNAENSNGCINSDTLSAFNQITNIYTSNDIEICNGDSATLNIDSIIVTTDFFNYGKDKNTHNYKSENTFFENSNSHDWLVIGGRGITGFVEIELDVVPNTDIFALSMYFLSHKTVNLEIDGIAFTVNTNGAPGVTKKYFSGLSDQTADGKIILRFFDDSESGAIDDFSIRELSITSLATEYNWSSNPEGFTSSDQSITVSPSETTQYIASYTFGNCTKYDTTTVTITAVNLGEDIQSCKGETISLNAGTADSYSWNTGETTQYISVTEDGDYSVEVSKNGCTVSDEINIVFNDLPIPDLGEDKMLCEDAIITLTPGVFKSYKWSTGETTNSIDVSSPSANTYVTVTDDNNCSASDNIHINWIKYAETDLGEDQIICENDTITLSGIDSEDDYNYEWSTGETSQSIDITDPGKYYVSIVDNNDLCPIVDSIQIFEGGTVNLGPDIEICENEELNIDAGLADSYEWNTGETSQIISPTASGNYVVTINDACGTATDDINITINASPSPTISGNLEYCEGQSTNLDAGSNYVSYKWSNSETTQTTNVTKGDYYVEVEDDKGCKGTSETVTVIENLNPTPIIFGDLEYCEGQSTNLDAGSNYVSYKWSNNETTQTTNVTKGDYYVEVEDNKGCKGTSEAVTVIENPKPNVFLGNDTTICEGNSLILNAGTFNSYLWNDNSNEQTLEINSSGKYFVEVINSKGCVNSDTINIIITNCTNITNINSLNQILIYPNPAKETINIQSSTIIINKIEILNPEGKTLISLDNINKTTTYININNLSSGIYFIKIQTNKTHKLLKFIKQ